VQNARCRRPDGRRRANLHRRREAGRRGVLVLLALALLTPAVGADIMAHGTDLTISGQIEWDDGKVFAKTVTPATRTVYLTSPGGYLEPALQIAALVRLGGYETVVGYHTSCVSGCALIWFAGTTRRILPGGRVGVHSASTEKDRKTRSDSGNARMIGWLWQMGTVPEAVLSLIEKTEPGAMYYIGPVEAAELGLAIPCPTSETCAGRTPEEQRRLDQSWDDFVQRFGDAVFGKDFEEYLRKQGFFDPGRKQR
jgi:hypothetical protein